MSRSYHVMIPEQTQHCSAFHLKSENASPIQAAPIISTSPGTICKAKVAARRLGWQRQPCSTCWWVTHAELGQSLPPPRSCYQPLTTQPRPRRSEYPQKPADGGRNQHPSFPKPRIKAADTRSTIAIIAPRPRAVLRLKARPRWGCSGTRYRHS